MHEIKIENKIRKLPGAWEELSPALRVFVIKTLMVYKPLYAKIYIIKKLLNIKKNFFRRINAVQMLDLIELLDYINLQDLTTPIFPRIKIRHTFLQKIRIYKPFIFNFVDEKFETGTAYQYAAASDYYKNYIETHDEKELDKLLAVLYTDIRIDKEINSISKVFSNVSAEVRISALAYFAGVQKYVYNNYRKWLFDNDEDSLSLNVNFGWWGRYMDIAELGVFGDIQKVYKTRFYDICVFLIQKKEQYLAEKEKLKEYD